MIDGRGRYTENVFALTDAGAGDPHGGIMTSGPGVRALTARASKGAAPQRY